MYTGENNLNLSFEDDSDSKDIYVSKAGESLTYGIRTNVQSKNSKSTLFTNNDSNYKRVDVDALVLIKIIRHCRDNFPTTVNGLLIGLDHNNVLEITDCFSLQNKHDLWSQLSIEKIDTKDLDEKVLLEDQRYQAKMLEQLNFVNADCLTVGCYSTRQLGDTSDISIIESLIGYQDIFREALFIGFYPDMITLGVESFKAFRLSDQFLSTRRLVESEDASVYNQLRGKDILVEIPIHVKNSLLLQAFILDWRATDSNIEFAGISEALREGYSSNYVQKTLGYIINSLDDLQQEQEKIMKFQKESIRKYQKQKELAERTKLENEQRRLRNEELLPEIPVILKKTGGPSQLPTLLTASQICESSETVLKSIIDNLHCVGLLCKELTGS